MSTKVTPFISTLIKDEKNPKRNQLIKILAQNIEETSANRRLSKLSLEIVQEVLKKAENITVDAASKILSVMSEKHGADAIILLKSLNFKKELKGDDCIRMLASIKNIQVCEQLNSSIKRGSTTFMQKNTPNSSRTASPTKPKETEHDKEKNQSEIIQNLMKGKGEENRLNSPKTQRQRRRLPLAAKKDVIELADDGFSSEKSPKHTRERANDFHSQKTVKRTEPSEDFPVKRKRGHSEARLKRYTLDDGLFYKNNDNKKYRVKASSIKEGTPRSLVNQDGNPFITKNDNDQSIYLTAPVEFIPKAYMLKGNSSGFRQMKKWEVRGVTNEGDSIPLDKRNQVLSNQLLVFPIACKQPIRRVVLTQKGENAFNDYHLYIGAFDVIA